MKGVSRIEKFVIQVVQEIVKFLLDWASFMLCQLGNRRPFIDVFLISVLS
jgi:hypothetical protein